MERRKASDTVEILKLHSVPNEQIAPVHLTDAVMSRIAASQQDERTLPLRRVSIYAAVLLIVLLASTSAYAATKWIQIRDNAGQVKIESNVLDTPVEIVPYEQNTAAKKPDYRERALKIAEPDQVLAYYVNNGHLTGNIRYVHNTRVYSFNDLKKLILRTSAPMIKEPANLPEGFAFLYGSVTPIIPTAHDTKAAADLLEIFLQRAEAEPDQDLFVEEIAWSEAGSSELEYDNGISNLRIQAIKNAIGMEISFPAEYSQKTVSIGGIETLFASGTINGFIRYEAIWYDETNKTHYHVRASGDVKLSEAEFLQIIENLIADR